MEYFRLALARGKWTSVPSTAAHSGASLSSAWRFFYRNGRAWTGNFEVESVSPGAHEFVAKLTTSAPS